MAALTRLAGQSVKGGGSVFVENLKQRASLFTEQSIPIQVRFLNQTFHQASNNCQLRDEHMGVISVCEPPILRVHVLNRDRNFVVGEEVVRSRRGP